MQMAENELTHLMGEQNTAWYALYTKHQHEKKAAEILREKSFDVLVPLYKAVNQWKDRKKEVLLPVFPCYVFVRAELDRKLDLLRTPGVFWMVSSGEQACVVPEQDIQMVRQISSLPQRVEPHPYLTAGKLVRVRSGPFAGMKGVLTRVKNEFRVVISVELLRKSVALELEMSVLEPCGHADDVAAPAPAKSWKVA